ncbi:MAG: hypothetical protein ACFE9Q_04205 [Candidatus Hodarchaeota archaeon]
MKITKLPIFILIFSFGFLFTNISIPIGVSMTHFDNIHGSCSIFTAAIGDTVLFGNNEDYLLDGTYMWFFPSQKLETSNGIMQTYGAVFFGFDNNDHPADGYVQGGMNDKGLCWDGNGLPVLPMIPHPEREDTHQYFHFFMEILWECSTVNETIEWYESHYLGDAIACQMHFADATGDAVVISRGLDGELAFTRISNSTHLISTNFNLADYSNGWYPCTRYSAVDFYLESLSSEEDLTVSYCEHILDVVSTSQTSYSNIFDLPRRDIYVYYESSFNRVEKLNLDEELENLTTGMNGEPTTLGYNTWILGNLTSNAIRIGDLFPSQYPWFPETPDPENVSLNPWLLIPFIFGIGSLTVGAVTASIFGSKRLIRYFKKHRIE